MSPAFVIMLVLMVAGIFLSNYFGDKSASYRALLKHPETPVDQINEAKEKIRFTGKVVAIDTITSPLRQEQCCAYLSYVTKKGKDDLDYLMRAQEVSPFYVENESGKILVTPSTNPKDTQLYLEYEVIPTPVEKISPNTYQILAQSINDLKKHKKLNLSEGILQDGDHVSVCGYSEFIEEKNEYCLFNDKHDNIVISNDPRLFKKSKQRNA